MEAFDEILISLMHAQDVERVNNIESHREHHPTRRDCLVREGLYAKYRVDSTPALSESELCIGYIRTSMFFFHSKENSRQTSNCPRSLNPKTSGAKPTPVPARQRTMVFLFWSLSRPLEAPIPIHFYNILTIQPSSMPGVLSDLHDFATGIAGV